ncbi:MAG: HD domain-containing phosphohydrolase [Treponema sp.]|nr:HD domain-containing phosphohydrolase [Treponema sp.]
MSTVKLENLKSDLSFNGDLQLDKNFILLPAKAVVSDDLIKVLTDWNFTEFQCSEEVPDFSSSQEKKQDSKASSESKVSTLKDSVKQALAKAKTSEWISTERSKMNSVQTVYNEYMNYINSVYTHYATHKKIDFQELSDTVKDLCVFIKDNKRYVLRITPSAEARSKNFLVIHSMRSTVLAITVGLELHMALSKLIELGISCILHEIGMLRLPPQLYMTDRPLTAAEKAQIMTHPHTGFNILKDLEFPLSILLGVLEHHEKENGLGYPRHLPGNKITTYAKIISVACSFEAITAPREYKSERTTFDAMVEMLKNPNGQYDSTVIKALLYSLSLYPIGAYVCLQNGKIGIVTDVSPNNPKNPIVQLANERNEDGTVKAIQTDDNQNRIVRVLSKEEQQQVQKDMEQAHEMRKLTRALEAAKEEEDTKSGGFSSVDLSEFA